MNAVCYVLFNNYSCYFFILQSTFLSCYVSKDPKKEDASARKVMSETLGNSVGKLFSLRGQKGKKQLEKLNIWAAIKGNIFYYLEVLFGFS